MWNIALAIVLFYVVALVGFFGAMRLAQPDLSDQRKIANDNIADWRDRAVGFQR